MSFWIVLEHPHSRQIQDTIPELPMTSMFYFLYSFLLSGRIYRSFINIFSSRYLRTFEKKHFPPSNPKFTVNLSKYYSGNNMTSNTTRLSSPSNSQPPSPSSRARQGMTFFNLFICYCFSLSYNNIIFRLCKR